MSLRVFRDPPCAAESNDKRHLGRLGLSVYVLPGRVIVWDSDFDRLAFERQSDNPTALADRIAAIDHP